MFRVISATLIAIFLSINAIAQSPTASTAAAPRSPATASSPSATSSPASPVRSATSTPTPPAIPTATPTTEQLINSLSSSDVQTAISLLKNRFTNPDALNETDLNRATLQGLVVRLNKGLLLLPGKGIPIENPAPFYSELLEGQVGYIRPGTLNAANLKAFDKALTDFATRKANALVLDLRASEGSDFSLAAEFAKRLVSKGKPLFSLRKQGKSDRTFTSDRDPAYMGLIVVLVDSDTSGGAEAVAVAVHYHTKALLIGQATAGRAVEYSDQALPSGKILRIAVSDCAGPDGKSLYPHGATPDLPVEMSSMEKRQIFLMSMNKGMTAFIHDMERPHLNEAALIAGTNPELEPAEQRRVRAQANAIHDGVLQRALDLITSLEIYQKR